MWDPHRLITFHINTKGKIQVILFFSIEANSSCLYQLSPDDQSAYFFQSDIFNKPTARLCLRKNNIARRVVLSNQSYHQLSRPRRRPLRPSSRSLRVVNGVMATRNCNSEIRAQLMAQIHRNALTRRRLPSSSTQRTGQRVSKHERQPASDELERIPHKHCPRSQIIERY